MRYLAAHYPPGGFADAGAAPGEFVFPDFSVNGSSTRWFIGVPSFKKCQYAAVSDDVDRPEGFINASTEAVRKYYPGIPKPVIDRIITAILLTLAREAAPVGTTFRIYVEPETASLQYADTVDGRLVQLWSSSPVTNNQS